jgi:hypothetical protein
MLPRLWLLCGSLLLIPESGGKGNGGQRDRRQQDRRDG